MCVHTHTLPGPGCSGKGTNSPLMLTWDSKMTQMVAKIRFIEYGGDKVLHRPRGGQLAKTDNNLETWSHSYESEN